MRITTTLAALKSAITEAARVTSKNVTLPALSGVLLRVDGGRLEVEVTDLELSFHQPIDGTDAQDGVTLVPTTLLHKLLGKIKDTEVTLELREDKLILVTTAGDVTIRAMQAGDFPTLLHQELGKLHLVRNLPDLLARVSHSAGKDDGRPVLTGVKFDGDALAATDAYRLAVVQAPGLDIDALVPVRSVQTILKAKPETLHVGALRDNLVTFHDPATERTWSSKLIEGTFPNYKALMPDAHEAQVHVGRKTFAQAIEVVSVVAMGQANTPIIIEANGGMTITANNQEMGDVSQTVRGYRKEGPDTTIAFNPAFVTQILAKQLKGDEVVIQLRDGLKPGVFTDPDDPSISVLLMPMRVS